MSSTFSPSSAAQSAVFCSPALNGFARERFMSDMFWRFSGREQEYVAEVLQSGFGSSTTGTMNQRFEREFSKRFGVRYAVTFNSGTSTLHAALAAFGIGPGDE